MTTTSEYLIRQLLARGVKHVFGVPGDYALSFFYDLEHSDLQVVNTCDESGAGFAADAYARLRGLGVACVTYCVGGLKVANTTAQAYAEKSPVVVISGAPGIRERRRDPLLHHKVREFDTQLRVFQELTVAYTVIRNSDVACAEIDRVLGAAERFKRPVYIELPRDMVRAKVKPAAAVQMEEPEVNMNACNEAVLEAEEMINRARQPVVIAGIELHRFSLQRKLLEFVEKTGIPFASTLLSKSVVSEQHPLYMGVYEGALGRTDVRHYVESSDCVILLGTFMTDINMGVFTAKLDQARSIYVSTEKIAIRHHTYEDVPKEHFINGLLHASIKSRNPRNFPRPVVPEPFKPNQGRPITMKRLFQKLSSFLREGIAVIADPGDAMFGAADMYIKEKAEFISPAYYTSLGFAIPASIGVQLANPGLRPLVLVGDGAFQMSGMELSTAVRFGLSPIIVLFNNRGYGTERPMIDGRFNDVLDWCYSRMPELLGAGAGFNVKTEDQLEHALEAADRNSESFTILNVSIDPDDRSPALERLTAALAAQVITGQER